MEQKYPKEAVYPAAATKKITRTAGLALLNRPAPPPTPVDRFSDYVEAVSTRNRRKVLFGPLGMTGGVIVLAAYQKSSKSALSFELAVHAAHGRSLADNMPNEAGPLRTLVVDAEMDQEDYISRYHHRAEELENFVTFIGARRISQIAKEGRCTKLEAVLRVVNQHEAEYVVLDNAATLFEEVSHNVKARKEFNDILDNVGTYWENTGRWRTFNVVLHVDKGQKRKAQESGDLDRPLQASDIGGASDFLRLNRTLWLLQKHPTEANSYVLRHTDDRGLPVDPDMCYMWTRHNADGDTRMYLDGVRHVGEVWRREDGAHKNNPKAPHKDQELELLREAVTHSEGLGMNSKADIFREYQRAGGRNKVSWVYRELDKL